MNFFYIDTSSSYLYSGIVSNDKVLSSCKTDFGRDLSKYTLNEVEKLFKNANLKPNQIDKIIVVSGPGSFTGIRIAMTIAKIMAWSFNIELATITSLDAMAASSNENVLRVPIIDARRGYVYAGVYDKDKVILENQYIKLDNLKTYLTNLKKEYIFITNQENEKINKIKYDPDILKIVNCYKDKESINPHVVEPTYFKLTEAEENLGSIKYDN